MTEVTRIETRKHLHRLQPITQQFVLHVLQMFLSHRDLFNPDISDYKFMSYLIDCFNGALENTDKHLHVDIHFIEEFRNNFRDVKHTLI